MAKAGSGHEFRARTLIRRSLAFHARAHAGVVAGAAIASAALVGALIMGDSVRGSLRQRALEGLGTIQYALASPDRFVTERLALEMSGSFRDSWREDDGDTVVFFGEHPVGVLLTAGTVAREDAAARANRVQVIGLDYEPLNVANNYVAFWHFYPGSALTAIQPGEVWLNETLASRLGARVGETVLLRVPKAGALSPEAAIGTRENSVALRLRVAGIRAAADFGNFSLRPGQGPPLNAFVNLGEIQTTLGLEGRVNTLLSWGVHRDHDRVRNTAERWLGKVGLARWAGRIQSSRDDAPVPYALEAYAEELKWRADLADYEAALSPLTNGAGMELKSRRVFLDPPLLESALGANTNAFPILTYLANLMVHGTNTTPYSMVCGAGPPLTPPGLAPDEIVLNEWLAQDLQARPGDWIDLVYFEPESGAGLLEKTNRFRVRSVVPLALPWADRTLMPDFPGIEKAERASDWDAGFPLVHKIRQKDEDYWKDHRGTPKAFVSLAAGQRFWGNRFGQATSVRFANVQSNVLAEALQKELDPAKFGLRFEPVRAQALQAAAQSQDFGQLFIGFSFFVVASALVLMALLFLFALEQRASETGTLLALGFAPKRVRRLLLAEGAALVIVGAALGVFGGLMYAKAMLWGLSTIWRDAVAQSALGFHVTTSTLLVGFFSSLLVGLLVLRLALRRQARQPAVELLAGKLPPLLSPGPGRARIAAVATFVAAAALIGWSFRSGSQAGAGAFFGAGSLLLCSFLAAFSAWLRSRAVARDDSELGGIRSHSGLARDFTIARLSMSGMARRRSRSLATAALLSSAAFVIASVSVFRLEGSREALKPGSGTGGFALYGESTLSVAQDLRTPVGRDALGLNEPEMDSVAIVPFRVRHGDEASCLNLNRSRQPRLIATNPELLRGRFTFAKVAGGKSSADPWRLLRSEAGADEVPAIGDANSIQWAMGKRVGETIDYVDSRGRPFKVRLVAAVANSILQGSLVIDEAEFVRRFPDEPGYRAFLVDAAPGLRQEASERLSRALQDYGLELTLAADRLNAFNAVQNTYLGTFQVLGGLGLLLGSAGLGIVVLRNVLERRGELGVLLAVGFGAKAIRKLVLLEHGVLLLAGLGAGGAAAGVAVLPSLLTPGTQFPVTTLGATLLAVLLNGFFWTWLATRHSLRGDLLAALRNES